MRIAYIRVSTAEQNEERQAEALKKYDIEKWFSEKVSAKDMNRPELQNMLDFIREGDTVYVQDMSRLARNTKDLLNIVERMEKKNVKLVSDKENIDTNTPTGRLMLVMIGAVAEFERQNLLERQREGIEIAKRAGKYKGAHQKVIPEDTWNKYYQQYKNREINKAQMAKKLKISRPTLDKLFKKVQEKEKEQEQEREKAK